MFSFVAHSAPAILLDAYPLIQTDVRVAPGSVAAGTAKDTRPVVRCAHCQMVQFRTSHNRCRRCYFPFVVEPPPSPPAPAPARHPDIAAGVRSWRRVRGLTQKQLASAAHLPRTYISRIENGRILPGLHTLERVAGALHVNLPALFHASGNGNTNPPHYSGNGNGHGNGQGGNGDGGDDFLRQILRYSPQLTPAQRAVILARVRQLAALRN